MSIGRLSPFLPWALCLPMALAAAGEPEAALAPVIASFSPTQGPVGTVITLNGSGFSSRWAFVVFGGSKLARATYVNASTMRVVVPRGAVTGPFTLVTRRGRAASPGSFTVSQSSSLAIASFAPASGPVGTAVTLTGSGFAPDAAVAFNGVAATSVTYLSATQLRATVPAGASSGRLTVRQSNGSATSAGSFTVQGAVAITSFAPAQGPVGTAVTLTGSGFAPDAAVSFNGVAATSVTYLSPTQVRAIVPAGAASGPITLRQGTGSATSPSAFTVQGSLAITAFTPAQGPVGTVVTLTGTGFAPGATVSFNGTAAQVTYVSASQLKATVPGGATTGPLTVRQGTSSAQSATAFAVQNSPTGLDLFVGGWYLNQSVQTLDRSIPLVAGKNAFLRVFAQANAANSAAPKVRVTLTGGSPSPWVQTLNAPGSSVPTSLAEGNLASSWNINVPGAVLAPGATLKVEIDPDGAVAESSKANNTLTANLEVRRLAPFRTTLIPVTQQGLTGNVASDGRTLASWVGLLRAMYPVADGAADLDVALGAPYSTQANLNSGSDGWNTLLGELNNKRVAEGSGRYYYGAVRVNYSSGLAGLGYIGAPTAIGWDQYSYDQIFAHETGHNFNRQHAPCNVSGDSNWPADAAHANAQIGVYGFDTSSGTAKAPTAFKDVMSYCSPVWVSDYTYKGILDWRTAGRLVPEAGAEAGAAAAEPELAPRQECLLVSGHVRHGMLAVDPAYLVVTRPALPEPGEYALQLKDRHGVTLREVPFGTVPVADGLSEERSFAFAVPLDCQTRAAYHGFRVVTPMGGLLTRIAGPGEVFQLPTATSLGAGVVRVQWDAKAFPTAMLRDPATHEVLAFARDGLLDLNTQAKVLEISLSDGVRSQRLTLKDFQ